MRLRDLSDARILRARIARTTTPAVICVLVFEPWSHIEKHNLLERLPTEGWGLPTRFKERIQI